jgi:(1->4)-alpha-D-glucan 1-alpha-D-glucosylmutase
MNELNKTNVDGALAPDRNDEYLFYQTLIGAWPGDQLDEPGLANFRQRVTTYMGKAIKEAKVHTSWVNPNEAYDRAVERFVRVVLSATDNAAFLRDLQQFVRRIAQVGMVNSLAQTLFKITTPGVPDFYQGSELWDLSLVDPDNRRPVDFRRRRDFLAALKCAEGRQHAEFLSDFYAQWQDGRAKLYLGYKLLNYRRARRELFESGDYLPLFAEGRMRRHICAFARRHNDQWTISAAPRLWTHLVAAGFPLGEAPWQQKHLMLPINAPACWINILSGESIATINLKTGHKALILSELFAKCPVAFLDGLT